jgi:hypothetical protein
METVASPLDRVACETCNPDCEGDNIAQWKQGHETHHLVVAENAKANRPGEDEAQ